MSIFDDIKNRLYISGMDPGGDFLAREYGIGFEITKFSWALMLSDEDAYREVLSQMEGIDRFWLHGPFAEMFPCAIDPLVRDIAKTRFLETIQMAKRLSVKNIVFHGGFIPMVYFPEWFVEQSVIFWKEFLREAPEDFRIALENVMDPDPQMLVDIVKTIGDERLGLCLDIGHANSFVSKLPVYDWVLPMSPYLFHSHIHNNEGDKDIHAAICDGTIDIKRMISLICDTKASITIETMEGKKSVEYLMN